MSHLHEPCLPAALEQITAHRLHHQGARPHPAGGTWSRWLLSLSADVIPFGRRRAGAAPDGGRASLPTRKMAGEPGGVVPAVGARDLGHGQLRS